MLDHDEQLFQFYWDLHKGREDHQERPAVFPLDQLAYERLDNLSRLDESVEIHQDQNARSLGLGWLLVVGCGSRQASDRPHRL